MDARYQSQTETIEEQDYWGILLICLELIVGKSNSSKIYYKN